MSLTQAYTLSGNGTTTFSAASTNVAITPSASTIAGDLILAPIYTGADATLVKDAGDGWVVLDSGYDSTNLYGILIAACIAFRGGNSGYAGLTLPSSAAYICRPSSYHLNAPYRWDLSIRASSVGWTNATASSTSSTAPAINQPYPQVIDFVARGYFDAVGTTSGTITSFTERADAWDAAPDMGVISNDRTAQIVSAVQNASLSATLAAAAINRAGVRAMVGMVGNTMAGRGRYGSSRRAF